MKERVRIGLLGAGRIGRLHADNLAYRVAGAELVAIMDIDQKAAADCARRVGARRVATDARRVIEDPDVDTVLICSSTDTHADLIVQAREGKLTVQAGGGGRYGRAIADASEGQLNLPGLGASKVEE